MGSEMCIRDSYTSAPTVTIIGAGSNATATATVVAGVVTALTITNSGNDYNVNTVVAI